MGNPQRQPPGFFNIPPEETRTLKLPAVCLAHEKREPRPQMPSLEDVTAAEGVGEIGRPRRRSWRRSAANARRPARRPSLPRERLAEQGENASVGP
jgi:hypothetical protein